MQQLSITSSLVSSPIPFPKRLSGSMVILCLDPVEGSQLDWVPSLAWQQSAHQCFKRCLWILAALSGLVPVSCSASGWWFGLEVPGLPPRALQPLGPTEFSTQQILGVN